MADLQLDTAKMSKLQKAILLRIFLTINGLTPDEINDLEEAVQNSGRFPESFYRLNSTDPYDKSTIYRNVSRWNIDQKQRILVSWRGQRKKFVIGPEPKTSKVYMFADEENLIKYSRTSISRALDALERRGLVIRYIDLSHHQVNTTDVGITIQGMAVANDLWLETVNEKRKQFH
jgi:hypothetical protein